MPDVICPGCKGHYHETTESFDAEKINGSMFRLKQPYRSYRWDSFDESRDTVGDNIVCPECGSCYLDHNERVVLDISEFVCQVCGKDCRSKIGLISHERKHKNKQ